MRITRLIALAVVLATPAGAQSNGWAIQDVADPITDAKRAIRSLKGQGGLLVLKCDRNGRGSVYVEIISTVFLGDGRRPVILRFDKGAAVSRIWSYSNDGAILSNSILFHRELDGFFHSARQASTLAVRLERYDGGIVDLQFDMSGAADQLDQAYQVCGDTPPKQ